MKKGKYVLVIVLIFLFLITATVASFFFSFFSRPIEIKADSYLEIDLAGPVEDFFSPDFFTEFLLGQRVLSIHDLRENIRKAKVDRRIRCLLLRLGYLECDWAKVSDIREAVLDFRTSGKPVYAYIEEAPEFDKEYYLACACDRILLHPLGWLGLNGLGGWVPFLKNSLDKLGAAAEVEHVEEFKTAYNMFTEKGFTTAHRVMMDAIYDDIFSEYVSTVAAARKKTEAEIRALIDTGLFQGENAVAAGLVDELLYEDELGQLLKVGGKKLGRVRLADYSRFSPSNLGLERGRRVALIYAQGPIVVGEGGYRVIGSRTLSSWLRKAREDRSIEAIVLRVDSPGGSAVASDVIWREVTLAKKEKPLVVSMSDLAGSGGYWISMAAHKIVAHPQTLTGSIGVLAGKFNLTGLYEKLGITSERMTRGEKADLFTTFRPWTEEERRFLKEQILWTYDRFLSRAAEGRNLSKDAVNEVGRGRVWAGRRAKDLHLVDELGGLSKALELAKSLAGIPSEEDVRLVVWPKKTSIFGLIMGRGEARTGWPLNPGLIKIVRILQTMERENPWALMPIWLPVQ